MTDQRVSKRKRSEVVDACVFVERLHALMAQKGLSQAELADHADIARSALTQFLSNGRKPSADALVKLADVLDASTDFLLGRSDDSEIADLLRHQKILELVRLFVQLSITDQDRVIEMIRLMAKTATTETST